MPFLGKKTPGAFTIISDQSAKNASPGQPQAVAVTGASGMLGHDVVKELRRRGLAVVEFDRSRCDVTNADLCWKAIQSSAADVVINCAAYTNVNGAETETDLTMAVNSEGAANVAAACAATGARMIHVSTDYVFDGTKNGAYDAADATNPLNMYGRSKLAGEQRVAETLPEAQWAVVRTSWLYGANGPNFVKTMLNLARQGKDLKVINDQVGAPTYTVDLASALVDLAMTGASGIIHGTATGECTWYEFAREIFQMSGITPASLMPCVTADYPTPAVRPLNSRLSPASLLKFGVSALPHWQDGLKRYLEETGELQT